MSFPRRSIPFAAAAAMAAAVSISPSSVASAGTLPFNDPNVDGLIGFCGHTGQPVRSGTLADAPFVWSALSSSAAPDGYQHGKATLYAYQPRQDVDPGQWSGMQLTGSTTFTSAAHPVAQATASDSPLLYFAQAYPPRWDGLVEVRMYFSGMNLPVYSQRYPAAVIQIQGDRWSVVSGGTVACDAGRGVSDETQILGSSVNTPRSIVVHGGAMPAAGFPAPSGHPNQVSSKQPVTTNVVATTSPAYHGSPATTSPRFHANSAAALSHRTPDAGWSTALTIGVVLGSLAALAGLGSAMRRRFRRSP